MSAEYVNRGEAPGPERITISRPSDIPNSSRRFSGPQGFTLIEVLIVVAILVGLVSLVGVNVLRHGGEAKVKTAKIQMGQIVSALKLYKLEQGGYPTTDQGLEALVRSPFSGSSPRAYPQEGYLESREVPLDPWGQPFVYLAPGRSGEAFEILSYGSDGEPGGTDEMSDLSSSELR